VKFGKLPIDQCIGTVLAHSLKLSDFTIKKGALLDEDVIAKLTASGISELIVARLNDDDVIEDEAARIIADALNMRGVHISEAGTGRVNFHASADGVFTVSKKIVDAINSIDPSITFATLPNNEVVKAGRMVATVKIIPYAVSANSLASVKLQASSAPVMAVNEFVSKRVTVISTKLPGLKDKVIEKTLKVLGQRLQVAEATIVDHQIIPHTEAAVQSQIQKQSAVSDIVIIFGASAISDIGDVIPAGLVGAGGTITRFGMPVDPGNLLMLGKIGGTPVIGAPGCARSPAENGFDFVLNRLLADIEVTSDDIASMGVGGLLMEIVSRPQPREVIKQAEFNIAALVLAAGQSRRMGDKNKLTLPIKGKAMVCYPVDAASEAGIASILVVTGHQEGEVREAINNPSVSFVSNASYAEGLSTSLIAGIRHLLDEVTHALVLLGDMPEITSAMVLQLLDVARKSDPSTIVMATHGGKRGNPVLWPRVYFEALENIAGDTGARHIIGQNIEHVVEVELGSAASLDIDTPEAFEAFQAKI